jgi:hypothetical protein
MPDIIEPRVLKGFRDYLPDAEQARDSSFPVSNQFSVPLALCP